MTAKHTPGPWAYCAESGSSCAALIAKGSFICEFIEQPSEANGRLIASAPRMSEALKRAAFLLAEIDQANSPDVLALRNEIIACIKEATPEHYGL